MHCLIRSGSAFMEYEHHEALIFSPNKLALQSIADRINPFTDDNYIVVVADDVRNGAQAVIYCHHSDSDMNYSILNDDSFLEDTEDNAKVLTRIVVERTKKDQVGVSIKQAAVKVEITKTDMAEVFCQIGGEFVRHVHSYDDFCTLEAGLKRLEAGKNSAAFYESHDFANSLFHFQGFNLNHFDTRR